VDIRDAGQAMGEGGGCVMSMGSVRPAKKLNNERESGGWNVFRE